MFPEQPLGGLFEVALFDDLKKQSEEPSPTLQILVNVMNTTLREKLPLIVNRNGVKCVPLGIGPMYGVGNIEIVLRGLLYRCKNAEQTTFEPLCFPIERFKNWSIAEVSTHSELYHSNDTLDAVNDFLLKEFEDRRFLMKTWLVPIKRYYLLIQNQYRINTE